jgi:Ca2+-binding RTX toxin-like protein
MDQVIYQAGGVGEARLGADVDFAVVMGATDANDPDERVIRGGPGTFDWVVADIGVSSLELTPDTITGSFAVRYAGFEYVESGPGDDRFGIGTRGAYPSLVGREGDDVLDLRSATEGISVTLGQDPYGWRRWVLAYEFERVLGSPFADQLLGPDDETPVRMRGGDGPDVLRGGDGDDVLRGGAGFDACTGGSGVDLLSGCER